MIDELQPYPEYVPSGSPWLGAVPSHWEVRSLGSMTSAISRRNRPDLPLLSVVREKGVIPRSTMSKDENHNYVPDDLSNYKVVRAGHLVINKMKAWQGSLGIAPIDGIVSPAYYVFDLAIENRLYGQALLRSRTYVDYFARVSDGVRIGQWDLSINGMRRIPVAVPPPDEQAAIVRFLDHADRHIRSYIRAKHKLIKLLEEQKQAIIHQAVTRGLDPSVPMKHSPFEGYDLVPAHWRTLALKRVLRRLVDCEHKTAPMEEGTAMLVVRTTAVRHGRLRLSGTYPTSEAAFAAWTRRALPEAGDVIFTREAPAGEACVVPEGLRVCLGQRTVLMKLRRDEYDPNFLVHMIYGGPPATMIALASQGSTVGHFNMDDIANLPVYVPPLDEQESIVSELRSRLRSLEAATERAEDEIRLLRELRTRLIADVVTGQVDVRAAAAEFPDEPTDDEPLDDADERGDDDLDADGAPEDDDA